MRPICGGVGQREIRSGEFRVPNFEFRVPSSEFREVGWREVLGQTPPCGCFPALEGNFFGCFFCKGYLFDFVDYSVGGKRFLALISR